MLHNQTSVNCHPGFIIDVIINRKVSDVENRTNERKKKSTHSSKYKIELVNKVINRV